MKKFQVISKRYNLRCDVECSTAQQALEMAASFDKAFVLSRRNPLAILEM